MRGLRAFVKACVPKGLLRSLKIARVRLTPRRAVSLQVFGRTFRYGRHPIYRREYFPEFSRDAWLDAPDRDAQIRRKVEEGGLSRADAEACRRFAEDGYYIAEGLIEHRSVEAAFAAYDRALSTGRIVRTPGDQRYLNPHLAVPEVDTLFRDPAILRLNDLFLGGHATPFQTIGSHFGSQQLEHSDAIHMTTFPLGYMVAAWIACEDVHGDSGPLVYYPGSHRLPYYLSSEVGLAPMEFLTRGEYAAYAAKYEPYIRDRIRERQLPGRFFHAKKGDVLFWHHNLIHGGSPILDPGRTRKAFVCHYFRREAFCYHDLSGSRAHFPD